MGDHRLRRRRRRARRRARAKLQVQVRDTVLGGRGRLSAWAFAEVPRWACIWSELRAGDVVNKWTYHHTREEAYDASLDRLRAGVIDLEKQLPPRLRPFDGISDSQILEARKARQDSLCGLDDCPNVCYIGGVCRRHYDQNRRNKERTTS